MNKVNVIVIGNIKINSLTEHNAHSKDWETYPNEQKMWVQQTLEAEWASHRLAGQLGVAR